MRESELVKRHDREVLSLGDVTEEDIARIAAARVDPKHDHLNDEIEDWQPEPSLVIRNR